MLIARLNDARKRIYEFEAVWIHESCFFAERWLTPGAEYAVSEKLLLPRHWYTDTDMNADLLPGQDILPGPLPDMMALLLIYPCQCEERQFSA